MENKEAIHLLENHSLRKTTIRVRVLDLFLNSDEAISHSYLEDKLDDTDRVTLYRTLKAFEEKGLIHKAIDGTEVARYALCAGKCRHKHEDDHAHFHCGTCGKTICLDEVNVPSIHLPLGFSQETAHLIIKGTCEKCTL